jgi:hypothetical protein
MDRGRPAIELLTKGRSAADCGEYREAAGAIDEQNVRNESN